MALAIRVYASFRPVIFVRDGEDIKRFGSLSGEISQHQRKGLDDTYHGSSLELLFLLRSKDRLIRSKDCLTVMI